TLHLCCDLNVKQQTQKRIKLKKTQSLIINGNDSDIADEIAKIGRNKSNSVLSDSTLATLSTTPTTAFITNGMNKAKANNGQDEVFASDRGSEDQEKQNVGTNPRAIKMSSDKAKEKQMPALSSSLPLNSNKIGIARVNASPIEAWKTDEQCHYATSNWTAKTQPLSKTSQSNASRSQSQLPRTQIKDEMNKSRDNNNSNNSKDEAIDDESDEELRPISMEDTPPPSSSSTQNQNVAVTTDKSSGSVAAVDETHGIESEFQTVIHHRMPMHDPISNGLSSPSNLVGNSTGGLMTNAMFNSMGLNTSITNLGGKGRFGQMNLGMFSLHNSLDMYCSDEYFNDQNEKLRQLRKREQDMNCKKRMQVEQSVMRGETRISPMQSLSSIFPGTGVILRSPFLAQDINKKMWKEQNRQCFSCGDIVESLEVARICSYTGHVYCQTCLDGSKQFSIPHKAISSLDVSFHPVSFNSFCYLQQMYSIPVIPLSCIDLAVIQDKYVQNSAIHKAYYTESYRRILALGELLAFFANVRYHCKSCPNKAALYAILHDRDYLLDAYQTDKSVFGPFVAQEQDSNANTDADDLSQKAFNRVFGLISMKDFEQLLPASADTEKNLSSNKNNLLEILLNAKILFIKHIKQQCKPCKNTAQSNSSFWKSLD
ncbi:hypothetical protein RFI_01527, partial [Reticulomyxa filosa]